MTTPKANDCSRIPAPCASGVAPADEIIVVSYDAAWPQRFRVESQLIQMALADLEPAVEHIGSTSVPGLAAKPTIDMLVGVRSLAEFGRHVDRLADYGYEYVPEHERSLPDRRFFKRVVHAMRTHHVHVVELHGVYWQRYMAFRDRLRCDSTLAARYAALKRGLAGRHRFDRDAYTNGKTHFVEAVLADCALRIEGESASSRGGAPCRHARRQRAGPFDPSAPAAAARSSVRFRPHFGFCS